MLDYIGQGIGVVYYELYNPHIWSIVHFGNIEFYPSIIQLINGNYIRLRIQGFVRIKGYLAYNIELKSRKYLIEELFNKELSYDI
jgi:hypothetical protein